MNAKMVSNIKEHYAIKKIIIAGNGILDKPIFCRTYRCFQMGQKFKYRIGIPPIQEKYTLRTQKPHGDEMN